MDAFKVVQLVSMTTSMNLQMVGLILSSVQSNALKKQTSQSLIIWLYHPPPCY